jgi:hypothetical protein
MTLQLLRLRHDITSFHSAGSAFPFHTKKNSFINRLLHVNVAFSVCAPKAASRTMGRVAAGCAAGELEWMESNGEETRGVEL